MAPKGKPRDMTRWQETLRDPNITFPGESSEYRRARNQLLKAEDELRQLNQEVAAQRRALPAAGSSRQLRLRVRGRRQHGEVLGVVHAK